MIAILRLKRETHSVDAPGNVIILIILEAIRLDRKRAQDSCLWNRSKRRGLGSGFRVQWNFLSQPELIDRLPAIDQLDSFALKQGTNAFGDLRGSFLFRRFEGE